MGLREARAEGRKALGASVSREAGGWRLEAGGAARWVDLGKSVWTERHLESKTDRTWRLV